MIVFLFLFKQKTAYEMRISDWSSDVCSSDLQARPDRLSRVARCDQPLRRRPRTLLPRPADPRRARRRGGAGKHGLSVGCDQPVGRRYLYSPDPPEAARGLRRWRRTCSATTPRRRHPTTALPARRLSPSGCAPTVSTRWWGRSIRSEEHTSELQSLMRIPYAVFR